MIAYPAIFEKESASEYSHLWGVRIPGLDGTSEGPVTCGDNLEEARKMASELVDIWLILHDEKGQPFPTPMDLPIEPGWELVRPSLPVYWALLLRRLRASRNWTQAEAAACMGVSQPSYARMEDPDRANPTLKTLDKICRVFGVVLDLNTKVA